MIQHAVRSTLCKEFKQFELCDKGLPCPIPTEVARELVASMANIMQDTGLPAHERVAAISVLLAADRQNLRIERNLTREWAAP